MNITQSLSIRLSFSDGDHDQVHIETLVELVSPARIIRRSIIHDSGDPARGADLEQARRCIGCRDEAMISSRIDGCLQRNIHVSL